MKVCMSKFVFLERTKNLASTLDELPTSAVLMSIAPLSDPHNVKAKMLRNGLAITSFVILEDFLKNRIGEILENIQNSSLAFSSFHDELKIASTIDALDSISYRANNLKRNGEDWITFIQQETKKIASSSNSKFRLSRYSIGWNKSNIATEDIPKWLKIFRIKGGWNTIQEITRKAEVTLVSPETIFRSAAIRRHSAAHDPSSESLLSDLIQFTKDTKAIALGFDALLAKSLTELNKPNYQLITGNKKIDESDIEFRFILKSNRYWKEYKDTNKRALKRSYDLKEAIKEAKKRSKLNHEIILIKDEANSIIDWIHN
jgi:hypothetical protein